MHILEIPSIFPPMGGLFCLDQAKALKNLGNEVRILSNVQLGISISFKDYLTLPYHRFEHSVDGITVYQSYQRGIPKVVSPNIRRWLHIVCSMFCHYVRCYGKPDILHAHAANWAGYAAMLIGQEYHIPYVITEHSSRLVFEAGFGPAPSDAWEIPLLRKAYEHADMVIPVTSELVQNIACYFGLDYRWKAISNTIDVDYFQERERPLRKGRPFRFCCIANYQPLKGYDVLFSAFKTLRSQGVDAELHIAGRGTDTDECRSQQSAGIYAHGFIDKTGVRSLLYDCDAFVLASRSEAQPLVILEAMSTGLPVIATECVPQNLRIPGGCWIVSIDDANALSEKMKLMTEIPPIDGKALSERVRQIASPEVVGRQLEDVFREILSK